MQARHADILSLVLLVVLTTAYQLIFLHDGIGLIDEGHLANAARRIAMGEVLYRDVYTVYPPASFYAVSALFDLFGTSLTVVRAFHAAMTVALAVTAFGVARLLVARPWALLAALLIGLTGWEAILERCHYAYLYSVFPIAALGLLARTLRDGGDLSRERNALLCVGVLAGWTLAFRLVPFVGLSAAAIVMIAVQTRSLTETTGRLLYLIAGGLLIVIPIGAAFAFAGAGTDFVHAVFWTSFQQYLGGGELNLPFPNLRLAPDAWTQAALGRLFRNWEFYLPLGIYLAALVDGARKVRSTSIIGADPKAPLRLALVTFGAILFLRATGRSDYYHLAPVLAPAYLLGADFLARGWARLESGRANQLAALPVAALLLTSLWLHDVAGAARRAGETESRVELAIGGPRIDRNSALDDLVVDLRARTDEDEAILVLPWYPVLYFLAERPNPTRFDWLFPGYLTSDADREAIIDAITGSDVRTLVYNPAAIDGLADRRLAAFEPAIDRAIRQHFRPVKKFGRFVVMQRVGAGQRRPRRN